MRGQAKRYIAKNKPQIVVVAGSVGKTSTTQAVATVLDQQFIVRKTLHNYNTDLGVPCSIFARHFPNKLKNPFAWLLIILKNQVSLLKTAPFDVLVLELGTDIPGEIVEFAWLKPDIAVVTAVAAEHMEYFKTLDAVAKEELSVASYSELTIINKTMVSGKYLKYADTEQLYNYNRTDIVHLGLAAEDLGVVGDHSIDAVAAGIAVGKQMKLSVSALLNGAKSINSQPGRMKKLNGIEGSVLIDDSYNSSPEAVIAALDYLYSTDYSQRIALLGNMNELGETSADEHKRIGLHCDPKKLDLVVTLGPDSNNYTASAAKDSGCAVAEANTPNEAADIIKRQLKENAIVLLKGSQNAVFAEEATKLLLANIADEKNLVRQGSFWMKIKDDCFKDMS